MVISFSNQCLLLPLRLSFLEQSLKELNLDLSWYMQQFLLALATLLQVHGIGVEDGSVV